MEARHSAREVLTIAYSGFPRAGELVLLHGKGKTDAEPAVVGHSICYVARNGLLEAWRLDTVRRMFEMETTSTLHELAQASDIPSPVVRMRLSILVHFSHLKLGTEMVDVHEVATHIAQASL